MTQTVRCLCCSLRLTTSGDPLVANICQCIDCRRRSGAAFSYNVYLHREHYQIECPSKSDEREGQQRRKIRHHFCAD